MIVLACIAIVGLLALNALQFVLAKRERADLLLRIQAPTFAIQQEAVKNSQPLPVPQPDLGAFEWQPPDEDDVDA